MEVLHLPGATSKHPLTLPPPPASLACPAQNTSETYTQQVSYRPNPKSTTTTTKSQKKSCLLLSSEAFNSYFGLLLCVTHQIVTLQISVISAFSVFSDSVFYTYRVWGPRGALNFFSGGCTPRGFQNVLM